MEFARLRARGQTTIPKKIRDAANLGTGDVLAFEIEGERLVLRKVTHGQDDYLQALPGSWGNGVRPRTRKHGVTFERLDVVVVPFPFTERQSAGRC